MTNKNGTWLLVGLTLINPVVNPSVTKKKKPKTIETSSIQIANYQGAYVVSCLSPCPSRPIDLAFSFQHTNPLDQHEPSNSSHDETRDRNHSLLDTSCDHRWALWRGVGLLRSVILLRGLGRLLCGHGSPSWGGLIHGLMLRVVLAISLVLGFSIVVTLVRVLGLVLVGRLVLRLILLRLSIDSLVF